ncbi:MAG: YnbE family lipoprotein [Desulfobacterales bacterium]
MPVKKTIIMAGLLVLIFFGCATQHRVEVAPVEVKPIHITIDVNIRVDRALDDFFGDIDKAMEKEIEKDSEKKEEKNSP